MKTIGLLSDTHGYLPSQIKNFFAGCDEIWHAGDIGNIHTANVLEQFKPFKAVFGNIDGHELRSRYPEHLSFNCEQLKVCMIHIGGYPKRYTSKGRLLIKNENPGLFISGHSHILKVIYDQQYHLLHINPGSAGKSGFHKVITLIRFVIDGKEIKDLEIMEIDRKKA